METAAGRPFRLDESLFERMMFPKTPETSSIPTSSLALQRRMHPDIADLVRVTLYPELKVCESAAYYESNSNLIFRIMSQPNSIQPLLEWLNGYFG